MTNSAWTFTGEKLVILEVGLVNMRLFLAILLFVIGAEATLHTCDNEIQKTLNCLEEKFNDPGKSTIFADEYANDFKTLVEETLGKHSAHVKTLNACALNADSFDGNFFGPRGPMVGCSTVTVAATYLRDLLFNVSTSSSKNANVGLCLKKTLAKSLMDEIKPCLAAKMGVLDVTIPKMPIFDMSIKNQDALKTTMYRAMVHNRLHECHRDSSKKAYYSENLFKVKSDKFFTKHCDAMTVCSSGMKPACLQYRNDLKKSSCACVNELRDKWHSNFVKVRSMTGKFADRDFCVKILNKGMGNWRTKLRDAVDACVKDQGEDEHPFAFIADDTAVEAACDQLAAITDEKRHKVLDAVQAFHSFLAAINDNAIRFCDIEC